MTVPVPPIPTLRHHFSRPKKNADVVKRDEKWLPGAGTPYWYLPGVSNGRFDNRLQYPVKVETPGRPRDPLKA